jgi:hypothetical protein
MIDLRNDIRVMYSRRLTGTRREGVVTLNKKTNLPMNINNLSPEHKKLIIALHKRIEIMESRLVQLQIQVVRVEAPLMRRIAKNTYLSLN